MFNFCKRLQIVEKRIDFDYLLTYNLIIKGSEKKSKSVVVLQRVWAAENR